MNKLCEKEVKQENGKRLKRQMASIKTINRSLWAKNMVKIQCMYTYKCQNTRPLNFQLNGKGRLAQILN